MKRVRAAVIGVGHLGKEHARILAGMEDVDLVGVADANLEQAQAVARRLGTQPFNDYWPLLNLVDAASIVVPTVHHLAVGREFLARGIPLLVEKPLACSVAEAEQLADLAEKHGALLQVGHIERFNAAFEELRERTLQPTLIRAQRMGPYSGRSTDIGIVLDLMIHDIDLVLTLIPGPIRSVEAVGVSVFGGHEDIASARLVFASGAVAELTASRASPTASRQMQIWGRQGFAEIDFAQRRLTLMQPSEQVRLHGLDPSRLDPASRARIREELFTRHLEMATIHGKTQDQLTCELRDFITCVQTGQTPRVTGKDGLAALIAAEQVLKVMHVQQWTSEPEALLFPRQADQEVA